MSTSPVKFVNQMYADGAHGFFDALSFHPYHYVTPFSKGTMPGEPIEQVAAIRLDGGQRRRRPHTVGHRIRSADQRGRLAAGNRLRPDVHLHHARHRNRCLRRRGQRRHLHNQLDPKLAAETVAALIADLADGTAAPFDVTPYMPANPFLQGVQVFHPSADRSGPRCAEIRCTAGE
ncbi:hypothetical protein [Mycolicibacterium aromaticivorans]|uniref:hypothetical protein n=1 Tax=Mycolicibacterium aromaticivorans TaxID=318425 RepID=UPI00103EEB8E|nr:hypothetical protein [Mycolicibacterium aromaticivorans]